MSLMQFAVENTLKPGSRCSVCKLPVKLQLELQEGHTAGISRSTMSAYLAKEHRFPVSAYMIGHHFKMGHWCNLRNPEDSK